MRKSSFEITPAMREALERTHRVIAVRAAESLRPYINKTIWEDPDGRENEIEMAVEEQLRILTDGYFAEYAGREDEAEFARDILMDFGLSLNDREIVKQVLKLVAPAKKKARKNTKKRRRTQ